MIYEIFEKYIKKILSAIKKIHNNHNQYVWDGNSLTSTNFKTSVFESLLLKMIIINILNKTSVLTSFLTARSTTDTFYPNLMRTSKRFNEKKNPIRIVKSFNI